MQARFIVVHHTWKDYRHYFEATWFGLPLSKINESYVDGNSHFELPVATYDNDPSITQAANLALWAEASWLNQGKPWAIFSMEEMEYNVDVSDYIRQKGP
jgi:hypothetical protein